MKPEDLKKLMQSARAESDRQMQLSPEEQDALQDRAYQKGFGRPRPPEHGPKNRSKGVPAAK